MRALSISLLLSYAGMLACQNGSSPAQDTPPAIGSGGNAGAAGADSGAGGKATDGSARGDTNGGLEAGVPGNGSDGNARDSAPDKSVSDVSSESSSNEASDTGQSCPASTCTSVQVKFIGWILGSDGGVQRVEVAVDTGTPEGGPNGTIYLTTSATDPNIGNENALVGNFVTDVDAGVHYPPQYANDNNYCNVPDFGGRSNAYYLRSMKGLPVNPIWQQPCSCGGYCNAPCDDAGTGGMCDYQVVTYAQSCPNYGYNCVVTPMRIEEIEVLPTSADPTCHVCLYSSATPSSSTLTRCVQPNTTLSMSDLRGSDGSAQFPALLRLDDGTSCKSY
jgi:hypothetical protein